MKILFSPNVVEYSPHIIFGEGSVNIADEEFVKIGVEVDLGFEVEFTNLEFHGVVTKI